MLALLKAAKPRPGIHCCCSSRALDQHQHASRAWWAKASAAAETCWGCWQEIDYELEGRNAERFKNNFAKTPWIKVPRIYWSCTSTKVLPSQPPTPQPHAAGRTPQPCGMHAAL